VENNGIHPVQSRDGTINLKAGAHTIAVVYFDGGGQTELQVRWKGPGFEKQEIPGSVLSHDGQPMVPVGDAPFAVDAAKATRGKELFAQLNCAGCHAGTNVASVKAKPLAQLLGRQPTGCLAGKAKAGVPHFEINDRQRQVILAALGNQQELAIALEPEQQIRRTMTVFNCYACHNRDRRGGPEDCGAITLRRWRGRSWRRGEDAAASQCGGREAAARVDSRGAGEGRRGAALHGDADAAVRRGECGATRGAV